MRYRLRTLLIVLALALVPMAIAAGYHVWATYFPSAFAIQIVPANVGPDGYMPVDP